MADDVVVEEVVEETTKKQTGALGTFIDRLQADAEKAGVKGVGEVDTKEEVVIDENKDNGNGKGDELDYSHFTDIGDDEYGKIDEFLKEQKVDNPVLRHRLAMRENDYKKQHRLTSSREEELKQVKEDGKIEVETDKQYKELMDGFQKDFIGNYNRIQAENNLPDLTEIGKQLVTGTTVQARIKQFQENELIPKLEKQFELEDKTFVFDAGDAWKSGTPSYEFRILTANKEKEFESEFTDTQTKEKKIFDSIIKERDSQLQELQDTYFAVDVKDDGSDEHKKLVEEANNKFQERITGLDGMYTKMKEGDTSPSGNPFAIKNIFRGVYFDELSQEIAEKQVMGVHEKYNKLGLYLPKEEMPTDVSSIKGKSTIGDDVTKKRDVTYSPQNRFLNRYGK